jgi:hypothetical protein
MTHRESADLAEAKRQSEELTALLAAEPPPTDPAILILHPGLKQALAIVDNMLIQPRPPDARVVLSLVRDRLRAAMYTGAITASAQAEPVRAPRTCWACRRLGDAGECRYPAGSPASVAVSAWIDSDNTDDGRMPLPTATPCPGFEPMPTSDLRSLAARGQT